MIKITEFEKLICEESIIINHDLYDYNLIILEST